MPEITMKVPSLRAASQSVFEEGNVQSKQGRSISARHVVMVIEEVAKLINQSQVEVLCQYQTTLIDMEVPPEARDAMGERAVEMLENGTHMTAATKEVLNDIVAAPLLGQEGKPFLDATHYERQFRDKARRHGLAIRLDKHTGKFQTMQLG